MPTPSGRFSVAVAALRTGAAYLVVSVYTLVVGLPTLLLGLFTPVENLVYVLTRAGVRLALVLTGIRVRVTGREHIPAGRGVVSAPTTRATSTRRYSSTCCTRGCTCSTRRSSAGSRSSVQAIRHARCVPVYRDNRDRSIRWLDEAVPMLRAGTPFLFHPEGTRSRPGVLLPFKKGGFIMAIQAQVPIVPVTIHGSYDAMRRGNALIFPATIGVRIGEPIATTGLTTDERDLIIDQVRSRILAMLALGPIADGKQARKAQDGRGA